MCTYGHTHTQHTEGLWCRPQCCGTFPPERTLAARVSVARGDPGKGLQRTVGNLQQHRGRLPCLRPPSPRPHHSVAVKRGRVRRELGERPQWMNHPEGQRLFIAVKEAGERMCNRNLSWHTTQGAPCRNPQTPTHPIHPTENQTHQ